MSEHKKPVILPPGKIQRTYVTLDTIYVPLTLSDNKHGQICVATYRVADVNIDLCSYNHEYAVEQFIYRLTGVCCNVYDSLLVRACICLTKHVCCDAWTKRKQNFIILPDSKLLHANLYWITVFELVYKLKYPQSNNTNKCLVYALNCMLKSGMMTIDDCLNADKIKSTQYLPLHTYSLYQICTYLKSNKLLIPELVHRYYKIFGKRLKRKYKKDQMPGGHVCYLPKVIGEEEASAAYADAICKCIKLNPPDASRIITKGDIKLKKQKVQFADVRHMSDEVSTAYTCMYLFLTDEPARKCNIYSNPWVFVKNSILQRCGATMQRTKHIHLTSEYFIENTIVENSIRLLFTLYHECAHVYHWRAKSRHNSTPSIKAHCVKRCGATQEHHAHKFALWCLIMNDIPIDIINSTFSSLYGNADAEKRLNYSHQVLLRYCRWLVYLNSKYGKLRIPVDLGYIFVNHDTEKLYRPNEEIVIK